MPDNKIKGRTKKTRRTDKHNFYITSDMIYAEWLTWRESSDNVEDREVTEKLGQYILEIARGVSLKPSFRWYGQDLKDDMVQNACLWMIKALRWLKEEKRESFFNYLTRACYCSFYLTLKKHYRYVNIKRELMRRALMQVGNESEFARKILAELDLYEKTSECRS